MKDSDSSIIKNKSKFLKAHTSCGHKKAIEEMLSSPDLVSQLIEVKAADDVYFNIIIFLMSFVFKS